MKTSVEVLLFGPARDAMNGVSSVSVEVNMFPVSIEQLRRMVETQAPSLRFVLMNAVFAFNNHLIPKAGESSTLVSDSQCELILVPPVSGG